MANIIEARVRQKVDTEANWLANPLILLGGEFAVVVTSTGAPFNYKIGVGNKRFSDLPYQIKYDQGQFISIPSTALPTPSVPVAYSIVGAGTYTHAGGNVTVPSGKLGQLVWNGTSWSLIDMGFLPTQDVISKIDVTEVKKSVDSVAVVGFVDGKTITDVKSTFTETTNARISATTNDIETVTGNGWSVFRKMVTVGEKFSVHMACSSVSKAITLFDGTGTGTAKLLKTIYGAVASDVPFTFEFTIEQNGELIISNRNIGLANPTIMKVTGEVIGERRIKESDMSTSEGFSPLKPISEKTFYDRLTGKSYVNLRDITSTLNPVVGSYYLSASNQITANSNFSYYLFPVVVGDKFEVTTYGTTDINPAHLFSSSTTLNASTLLATYGNYAGSTGQKQNINIVIQQSGYLLINNRSASGVAKIMKYDSVSYNSSTRILQADDLNLIVKTNIFKSRVVSNWKDEILAHDGGLQIDNHGNCFMPYYSSSTDTVETITNNMQNKMSVWNICDDNDIDYYTMMSKGDVVGSFTQSTQFAPYVPTIFLNTSNDDTILYHNLVDNAIDNTERTQFAGRYWSKSAKAYVGNSLIFCKLSYTVGGVTKVVNLSEKGIVDMTFDLQGYSPADTGFLMMMGRWQLYGGEYYTFLGTLANGSNGISGIIIKTTNGIDFTFVSYAPTGRRNVWEGSISIIGNNLYCICRGSAKMFKMNLSTKVWVTSTNDVITNEDGQRHCLFYKDDKLYLMNNIIPTNGIQRSRVRISIVDSSDMIVGNTQIIESPFSFQYYGVYDYKGEWWIYFTEDRRGNVADNKGNISVMLLSDLVKI